MSATRTARRRLIRLPLLAMVVSAALVTGCDRLGSKSAEAYYQSAVEYRDQGKFDASVIELKNALQKDPDYEPARRLLGRLYLVAGNGQAAEKELKRALALGADARKLSPDLAHAYLLQRRYQDALDVLEDPAEYPESARPQVLVLMGHAERALGQSESGCARYSRALELDSGYDEAVVGLAACDVDDGRFAEARERLTALLARSPDNLAARMLLARVAMAVDDEAATREALAAILKRQPRHREALLLSAALDLRDGDLTAAESHLKNLDGPRADYLTGLVRYRQQRYADAEVALQKAVSRATGFDPAYLWLGIVHFVQGNYEQAQEELQEFVRRRPDATTARAFLAAVNARLGEDSAVHGTLSDLAGVDINDPSALAALAEAALNVGATSTGRGYLQAAVERFPDNTALRTALGVAFMEEGDAPSAIDVLDQAAAMDEEGSRADLLLIRALLAKKRFDEALDAVDRLIEKRPDQPEPVVLKGTIYLFKGDPQAARAQYEKALADYPDSIGARHGLAVLALRVDDLDAAREQYKAVLENHPGHLQTQLALYSLAVQEGDGEAAMEWLAKAATDNPESTLATTLYGRQLVQAGRPEEAVKIMARAVLAHPEDAALLDTWAAALLRAGEPRRAAEAYEKLSLLRPDSIPVLVRLATAQQRAGDAYNARQTLQKAFELDRSRVDVARSLVEAQIAAGDYDAAERVIDRLQSPEAGTVALLRAEVLAARGDSNAAADVLREAWQANPDDRRIPVALARLLWEGGEREAAVAVVEQHLSSHSGATATRRILAQMYTQLGQDKKAIAAYETILEVSPDDAVALNNLALLRWSEDPEAALTLARKAHELSPESAPIKDTLGWFLVQRGETEEGLKLLASARGQLAQQPAVRYHYAAALARSGRKSEAREELSALLEAFPEFNESDDARALLERL